MSDQKDIILLNTFLSSLGELGSYNTPREFLSYANARMVALGFQVTVPRELDLEADFGDVFLELDRWVDANEPDVNQLATRMGEYFYLNLVWADRGAEMTAIIVPDSEVDSEGSETGDYFGVDDF